MEELTRSDAENRGLQKDTLWGTPAGVFRQAAALCSEMEEKRRPSDVFGTEELALNRLLEFCDRLDTQGLEGVAELADRLVLGI